MSNTVDMIKNLLFRTEMNRRGRKNKRTEGKLQKDLENKFRELLMQEDDDEFFDDFSKMISSQMTEPYISCNFFPDSMGSYASYSNVFGFSNDFRYEIRWIIACILNWKSAINEFVLQREKYAKYKSNSISKE